MANPEHLAILKEASDKKDISIWNDWCWENPDIRPDLSNVDLSYTNLHEADLTNANLSNTDLSTADLDSADLSYADLNHAILYGASLYSADFWGANLSYAILSSTSLRYNKLTQANLTGIRFGYTAFFNIDFSTAKNLDTAVVEGPCEIGIDTLYKSQIILGEPWFLDFLEKCGVPETMRTFAQSLVVKPIDYYSCFISYSTKDEEFCQELQARLKRHGLRVWFAPEEMKGGQKIHEQIYEAIRYHDKLILVLSPASMNSNWVKLEIQRARKREKAEGRRVLFPILLTPYEALQEWELITSDGEDLAEEIRQYYIPDFTDWKNHDVFKQGVDRLIRDLQADDDIIEA